MTTTEQLPQLSDQEILQGFRDGDARIVKEYFYGYCRVAYYIYNRRYLLRYKPGMDFYSLAHEYYLFLWEHQFKPLEDRRPSMSLKTWMVNGFRYLLLDKLKGVAREQHFESFDTRQERPSTSLDVIDGQFEHELYSTIEEIGDRYYGHGSKNALILKMLYIEGFKNKDVAEQLGISAPAVTQRCQKMMHDVVIPYFKNYFVAADYQEDACQEADYRECEHSSNRIYGLTCAEEYDSTCCTSAPKPRYTPCQIEFLKPNEVLVTDSLPFDREDGIQGQCYGIPTMQGGTDTIRPHVAAFIRYACEHPAQHFLVTEIGCGISGFDPKDIAPLFRNAKHVENIWLPKSFL